jgi:hypothetical protein
MRRCWFHGNVEAEVGQKVWCESQRIPTSAITVVTIYYYEATSDLGDGGS